MRHGRRFRYASTFAAVTACACASGPVLPESGSKQADPDRAYPGRCSFVELQAVERPSSGRGTGPDNLGTGTVELVATYRPGTAPEKPVGYAFRVQQERVDDLRAHLQQHPDILCEGESADRDAVQAMPAAPSFEGQQGQRLDAAPSRDGAPAR